MSMAFTCQPMWHVFSASRHTCFACYDFHSLWTDISRPERHMTTRYTLHSQNMYFHCQKSPSPLSYSSAVPSWRPLYNEREHRQTYLKITRVLFRPEIVGVWGLKGDDQQVVGSWSIKYEVPFWVLPFLKKTKRSNIKVILISGFPPRVCPLVPHLILNSKITLDREAVQ